MTRHCIKRFIDLRHESIQVGDEFEAAGIVWKIGNAQFQYRGPKTTSICDRLVSIRPSEATSDINIDFRMAPASSLVEYDFMGMHGGVFNDTYPISHLEDIRKQIRSRVVCMHAVLNEMIPENERMMPLRGVFNSGDKAYALGCYSTSYGEMDELAEKATGDGQFLHALVTYGDNGIPTITSMFWSPFDNMLAHEENCPVVVGSNQSIRCLND